MRFTFYLTLSLLMTSCGYHLVGQGAATVIPSEVLTAHLSSQAGVEYQALLKQLKISWGQRKNLPVLQDTTSLVNHITLRIEQATESFVPVTFDAAGLAIQYRLQVRAVLNMYQEHDLLWGSGAVMVSGDVFGDVNPSAIEAERAELLENLRQQWAKEAMNRLQSGF